MDEVLRRWASVVGEWLSSAVAYVRALNPKQEWVMWVQLLAGAATIVWIIIQFAAWRRLNEARIERYIEDRIDSEREDLARERDETLARLDRVVARRGMSRIVMLAWAHAVLTVSFVLRLLSLGTIKALSDHSVLLLQVGKARRARRVYLDIAADTTKRVKRYEEALSNAKLEAQNALLFAGRVAVIENRPAAATAAFRKVLSLKDDAHARLLVARQMMANDMEGAFRHVEHALGNDSHIAPQLRSELFRCKAEILMAQNRKGHAQRALASANAIDEPLSNYAGLGRTEELRGDIFALRTNNRNAALKAYKAAADHYVRSKEIKKQRVAKSKLAALQGLATAPADGFWTRWLDRRSQRLVRRLEKRRARARSRAG
jgi:tetratricopeptide (TPR) repeat protein